MKLDKDNQEKYELLRSIEYPEKSGMLTANAYCLRSALKRLVECVENGTSTDYALMNAQIDLGLTTYLAYDEYLRKNPILSDEESLDEIADRELHAFNSLERG